MLLKGYLVRKSAPQIIILIRGAFCYYFSAVITVDTLSVKHHASWNATGLACKLMGVNMVRFKTVFLRVFKIWLLIFLLLGSPEPIPEGQDEAVCHYSVLQLADRCNLLLAPASPPLLRCMALQGGVCFGIFLVAMLYCGGSLLLRSQLEYPIHVYVQALVLRQQVQLQVRHAL